MQSIEVNGVTIEINDDKKWNHFIGFDRILLKSMLANDRQLMNNLQLIVPQAPSYLA